jgi:sialidase-1
MSATITLESTGLVYRNPAPHLRSVVAYHPSLSIVAEQELIATFDIGEAIESLDYHTVLSRSLDGGATWGLEGPLIKAPPLRTSHTARTSRVSDGSLVGLAAIFHRENPDAGLINRATFGFVPMDICLMRSFDAGRTWTPPRQLKLPLVGPSWEICHSILELRSGRWLLPTATWRGWNGENPSGEQTVAFISDDRGESWGKFGRIFDGREDRRSRLEVSVVELPDGRILAVGWVHDAKTCTNFPTEYCLSNDNAENFSAPLQTGFEAETCKLMVLSDGRIFCAYRRTDRPGLWGRLAEIRGSRWVDLAEEPLWEGAGGVTTSAGNSADGLSSLKFGYPSLQELGSGEVLLLFWCQESCVTNIRWMKIKVR